MGALPLRNMSRLWGYLNSLELPVWFRPYGFKLYALAFGCNLDEIEPSDLTHYKSLGDFFYRKLRDGVRPVDKAILVSIPDHPHCRYLMKRFRSVQQTERFFILAPLQIIASSRSKESHTHWMHCSELRGQTHRHLQSPLPTTVTCQWLTRKNLQT
jgi:hypothetical protein